MLEKIVPYIKREKGERIEIIDGARGIFIYWMIVGHSLFLAGVPRQDLLHLLRMRGWATTCFIMLTGFSIAAIFDWTNNSTISKKLFNRAKEIALAAYISNALYRIIESHINDELSFKRIIEVITFDYPWTISAILIPTIIVLIISPALLRIANRLKETYFLSATTILILIIGLFIDTLPSTIKTFEIYQEIMGGGRIIYFPILPFSLYGIWSFSLAATSQIV